ncbi:MAG: hypothetical protein AB7V46_11770 [Thermomicrobiales bacterium]
MIVRRKKFLSDVDGVVAGLMEGFSAWMYEELDEVLPVDSISRHSMMGESPDLQDLRMRLRLRFPHRFGEDGTERRHTSIGKAFLEFMSMDMVYQKWVRPLPGAIENLSFIEQNFDLIFVTATMKDAPQSYESKFLWLKYYFPKVRVCSIASELKQFFGEHGDLAVDDRYDLCEHWKQRGIRAMCLKRPWSQEPEGAETFDWDGVRKIVDNQIELDQMLASVKSFGGEF